MKFPEKLKELRLSLGLTQEEFSSKVGVLKNTLSSYENGAFYPSIPNLIKISEEYNVSIDDLLKDEKNFPSMKNNSTSKRLLKLFEKADTLPIKSKEKLVKAFEVLIRNELDS